MTATEDPMGTALLTEFRTTAPIGTIEIAPAASPLWAGGDHRYPVRYAGTSCAHPPAVRAGHGHALWQVLATVVFTAVAVTAILCIAHIRTSQVVAEAAHSIPVVTDAASPAGAGEAVTGGR
ncbi:hypothetical protein [Rhodococcus artemisiae]|uniref:Uncharacterized protein n=1 Tax=Rhodococcus artemisiae TaxID=714159 RepID=A0ABU7L490_9NOCA|nr:hypothetical protein [Rhodococcus artemisiae]MEE2056360.1 hypothetical protein [Rhodococcus artemisiae]